ncbi:aldo/keto reductase [Stereum hirsutum FP-91666 SS1]|uniref:aldo/keto reductase n=1 Tax=Stereum hirsutum (strain FP-91666) TaxID=721885 RepID=UPI000444A11F|nr:aldo/keto reductase [Stereum hirsutum FP-91666 SS1]EIM84019.1 aldo/keto reductase [Stereum hirsutum FP-91666 SS1]
MLSKTVTLSNSVESSVVAKTGQGLMMMTWKQNPDPDEQCFESMKAGMDLLPPGAKMFLNSAEFYGINPPTANLELLARFFEKYPEYVDKAFLSVKTGVSYGGSAATLEQNIRRRVDAINDKLRGTKKIDLFESARPVQGVPIELTTRIFGKLIQEGKFGHIGLSEVLDSRIIRQAHSTFPITALEVEVSPWSYGQDVQEVIATCEELGIAIVAHSPLGHGFLTGKWKKYEDMANEVTDVRKDLARFQKENFEHNLAISNAIAPIAAKKNVTAAQLCIAWVASRSSKVIPLPGSAKAARTIENAASGDIELSEEELSAINRVVTMHIAKGGRYF